MPDARVWKYRLVVFGSVRLDGDSLRRYRYKWNEYLRFGEESYRSRVRFMLTTRLTPGPTHAKHIGMCPQQSCQKVMEFVDVKSCGKYRNATRFTLQM